MVLPQNIPAHTLGDDLKRLMIDGLGDDTADVQRRILDAFAEPRDPKCADPSAISFSHEVARYIGTPARETMTLATMMHMAQGREDLRRHTLYAHIDWMRTQAIICAVPPNTPGMLELLDKNFRQAHAGTFEDIAAAATARRKGGWTESGGWTEEFRR